MNKLSDNTLNRKEKEALKEDFLRKLDYGGSFFKSIANAITIADSENLGKLYKAYPELVDGYVIYVRDMTYSEYIEQLNYNK